MNPSYPGIGQDTALLDGYVGWIESNGEARTTLNESLVVVHLIPLSDSLQTLQVMPGGEDGVVHGVQGLIGKTDRGWERHCRS